MSDIVEKPNVGWRCSECEVYTSRPKEEHVCLAVKCEMCGWRWRAPLGVNLRHTSWGKCCCNDVDTCLHHQVSCDDGPIRPPQAELEARAKANYDADLKRWTHKRDGLKRLGERFTLLEAFYQAMKPWVGTDEWIDEVKDDELYYTPIRTVTAAEVKKLTKAVKDMRDLAMWKVTPEQFEFLKGRFKDPLLWIEDCERWIGRPLVGDKVHWCFEWDGLPVDETTEEFDVCTCWDKENIDGNQEKAGEEDKATQASASKEDGEDGAGSGQI